MSVKWAADSADEKNVSQCSVAEQPVKPPTIGGSATAHVERLGAVIIYKCIYIYMYMCIMRITTIMINDKTT